MIRKSPYLEENYSYITLMMDNLKFKDEILNKSIEKEQSFKDPFFKSLNQENLFNFSTSQSNKNMNSKKIIEPEFSLFGNICLRFNYRQNFKEINRRCAIIF